MPAYALVAAPLILAAVLAASGIAKVRDEDEIAQRSWTDLGVPPRVNTRLLRRAHPWAEIALALALVVAPGWSAVVAATAAVVLCVVYLALVARAVTRAEAVTCDCFGSAARTPVTGRTVARNVLLLLLALGSLAHAVSAGSPLQALTGAPSGTWGWLLAVGLAALTTYLVLPAAAASPAALEALEAPTSSDRPDDVPDYVRTLTPMTHLVDADGVPHDLVSMSARRAHVLLFVNPGCGSCAPVVEKVPEWQELIPEVRIRLVVRQELADLAEARPDWMPLALYDADGLTARALRATSTPTAVLLGTDGMLAGGPVSGSAAVEAMVLDIAAELERARAA